MDLCHCPHVDVQCVGSRRPSLRGIPRSAPPDRPRRAWGRILHPDGRGPSTARDARPHVLASCATQREKSETWTRCMKGKQKGKRKENRTERKTGEVDRS